jgi:hypothetical protein
MNHDTTKVLDFRNEKKNYFLEVLAGLAAQKRQHSPLSFRKINDLKFPFDKLVCLAVKIKPTVLKTRSQAADEAKALLYSLAITSKISEMCTDDTIGKKNSYSKILLMVGIRSRELNSPVPSFT